MSPLPNLVRSYAFVTMTASGPLHHECPHVDETDAGNVEITWRVDGNTIELHSLAYYLSSWKDSTISHEEITDRIRFDLGHLPGLADVTVKTSWQTAGLGIECSTSPTPQRNPSETP